MLGRSRNQLRHLPSSSESHPLRVRVRACQRRFASAVLLSLLLWTDKPACAITASPLLELTGEVPGDGFGLSVAVVDANADGWNDILVGAPFGEAATRNGTLYVFFGGSAMDSIPDLVFHSPSPVEWDYFAGQLSGLSDFNADGYPDFLVGGLFGGDAHLYYGGPLLDTVPDVTFPSPHGFWTTASLTCPGDVNGDGLSDVALGATFYPGPYLVVGYGYESLFYGGPGANPAPSMFLHGAGRQFGQWAAPVGDVNGDLVSDFAVSDPGLNGGTVYVYLGKLLDTQPPWTISGSSLQSLGFRVGSAGDWDGDGFGDLIASGRGGDHIYFGGRDFLRLGIVLNGRDSNFGYSFAASKDATGDGVPDLFVASPGGMGRVYAYNGGSQPDASPDDSIEVGPTDPWSNALPLCAADLTGDGLDEVIAGAPNYFSSVLKGKVYVHEVAVPLSAQAFPQGARRTISLTATPADVCVRIEPVGGSYDNAGVDLSTIRLVSHGTGVVSEIEPSQQKSTIAVDGKGIAVWFAQSDLARLFSEIRGRQTIGATIEGRLRTRRKFAGQLELTIVGIPGTSRAASLEDLNSPPQSLGTLRRVFPSPSSGLLKVRALAPGGGVAVVDLFSITGQRVIHQQFEGLAVGEHDLSVDCSNLPSGVYFLQYRNPSGTLTRRWPRPIVIVH